MPSHHIGPRGREKGPDLLGVPAALSPACSPEKTPCHSSYGLEGRALSTPGCAHPTSVLRAQPPPLHTHSWRASHLLAVAAPGFPPQLSEMLLLLANCHLEDMGTQCSGLSTPLPTMTPPIQSPFQPGSPWECSAWTSATVLEVKLLKDALRVSRSLRILASDQAGGTMSAKLGQSSLCWH